MMKTMRRMKSVMHTPHLRGMFNQSERRWVADRYRRRRVTQPYFLRRDNKDGIERDLLDKAYRSRRGTDIPADRKVECKPLNASLLLLTIVGSRTLEP